MLGSEGAGLLRQESAQNSFGQAGRGGSGDLFHGLEIDAGIRTGLAERTAGNDFSPPGRLLTDFPDLLLRHLPLRHDQFSLGLAANSSRAFFLPFYQASLCPAKWVLASTRVVLPDFH